MKKSALYIDLGGYMPLPSGEALSLITHQATVDCVTDERAALEALTNTSEYHVIVSNAPILLVFTEARARHPKASTILVTDSPMKTYSAALDDREDQLVDHVIANRTRESWTVHELRITVQKLLTRDIFGIEKYLAPGTKVHESCIKGSNDRDVYNKAVMTFVSNCKLGQHTAKMAFGISEELLMNMIYDAPAAAGIEHYAQLPRTASINLEPHEFGALTYGCDGRILAIGASDPFGALSRAKLFQYLRKVLKRDDSQHLIDSKKGGAGLGLFKILYSSHGIVCNVAKKKRTEIMAIIDVEEQLRDFSTMARSIHFFDGDA
jgi:hypothetical protein